VTRYYDEDGITLYCADNRDVLPSLEANVDLVFTSPPYNAGLTPGGNGRGFYKHRTQKSFKGYGVYDDAMPR